MPRIAIEDKHTYRNSSLTIYGNADPDNVTEPGAINFTRALVPLWPGQGTDSNNRVGRKIMTSSIVCEGLVRLNDEYTAGSIMQLYASHLKSTVGTDAGFTNATTAAFSSSQLKVAVRHFVVECNPDDLTDILTPQWFQNLVIRNGAKTVTSLDMNVLRESTQYTGTFKILSDVTYKLSLKKPTMHYKFTIPWKRQLNFNNNEEGVSPTNKTICEFFIGPQLVYHDYGSHALGAYIARQFQLDNDLFIYVGYIDSTLKLNYVDI